MTKSGIVFLIILLIYWIGLIPINKAANDLPYSSISFVASQLSWPTAWNSFGGIFGQNQLATLWSWPNNIIYAFGANLGLEFGWLISLLGILPILLIGYIGMFLYARKFIHSILGCSAAGLFFLTNSYILLVIDGGQLLWGVAYSLMPWCLFFFDKYFIEKHSMSKFVLAIALLSFSDLRAVFLLGIIIFIQVLIRFFQTPVLFFENLKKLVLIGFFSSISLLLLHSYWILPLILSRSSALPSNFNVSLQADFLSFISLGHAMVLQQPHWYKNIYGELQPIRLEFLSCFLLLIPLFLKKNKHKSGLILLLIIGVFLAKGSQPPFGYIYGYLIEHIPGFFLFRDSSKFFILISLAYSVCFGLVIQMIEEWRGHLSEYKNYAIMSFLILFIAINWPVYTGQMTGLLGFAKQTEELYRIETELRSDQIEGRIVWIPQKPPLGFMDRANLTVNGTDLVGLRPFAVGIKGTYETLNFLREASYSGELLSVSGVKKLVYSPSNPHRTYKDDEADYYDLFLKQLQARNWVNVSSDNSQILNLSKWQPQFSIPENYYFVVGSDSVYAESTVSAALSLDKNGLIFLEEQSIGIASAELLKHPILLNQKNKLDLLMQMVGKKNIFYPSFYLHPSPNETGWWMRQKSDFLSFRDFLNQKYGIDNTDFVLDGGWAISEGEHTLNLPIAGFANDLILMRVLESTRSGGIQVNVSDQILNTLKTQNGGNNIKWHLLGSSDRDFSNITLKTKGDINIVNAIAVVPNALFEHLDQQISNHSSQLKFDFTQGVRYTDKATITYSKINDDQYKVEVNNLKRPSLIVFNQKYDPKWTLDGQGSIPVYSIFNGFIVNKNGSFLVEYSPHKYIWWGGFISIGSLLVIFAGVVYRYYVYKKNK